MKYVYWVVVFFVTQTIAIAQNYQIGHRQVTFVDSSRANRQIQCEIYYPAVTSGENVPIAGGKFPVLVFGHGFVMPVSAYDVYWNALVPKGYILVLPTTESSFSPSHTNFGKDMAHAVKSMRLHGALSSSPFFNAIDSTSAVMGHSMGGGCAFLAMQYDSQITALISFAGAVTNPSSVTAAMSITKPSLVIAGANDCVASPKNHQIPMYDSLASQCKSFVSIIGGDHCQFASYNFNCSFGQSTCTPKATINANTQQSILFQHVLPWMNYYLKHDCSAGTQFQALMSTPNGITSNSNCSLESPQPIIQGPMQSCMDGNAQLYTVRNAMGSTTQWTVPKKGIVLGSLNSDSISIIWQSTGIDTIKVRLTDSQSGCSRDTSLIVKIESAPKPSIVGNKKVCINANAYTYSVSQSVNTRYQWFNPKYGRILSDTSLSSISVEWNKEGIDTLVYRQTNTLTNCSKDTHLIVTINSLPEGEIYGEQLVCAGNKIVNYALQSTPGTTTLWHNPNNGNIIGSKTSNAVSIRWNIQGLDTLRATITDPETECNSDTMIIVTIQEQPKADIFGKKNICEDSPLNVYRVESVPGHSYLWTASSTGTIIGPRNLDSIIVRWTKVGKEIISVRETNLKTGCINDTSLTIIVNPKPRPYITGKSIVKEGDSNIVYAVPFNQGSMYSWNILSGDARIQNQDQYQVYIDMGKIGLVELEATESNKYDCASSDTFSITVQSASNINDDESIFSVYPNPAQYPRIIYVKGNHIESVESFSLMGEKKGVYVPKSDALVIISTEQYQPGIYVLRINTARGSFTNSIVIH